MALFQSLALGIRALNFSAEQALDTEGAAESKPSGGLAVAGSLLLALLFALGLFFYLPLFLTDVLARSLPALGHGFAYSLVDGGIRILLFILYILGISLSGEMRRVFRYHGAEHKVVHAYEAGEELTVANLHGSAVHDWRVADAELLRAATFADAFAEPEDVLVVAGDFNVVRERSSTLTELASWGFTKPIAWIDQVLVRGAKSGHAHRWPDERRRVHGKLLSDHAPVEVTIE